MLQDSYVERVIESAVSYHTTPNKELFIVYNVGDFGKIWMGNSSNVDIMGVSYMCIQTKSVQIQFNPIKTTKPIQSKPKISKITKFWIRLYLVFTYCMDWIGL